MGFNGIKWQWLLKQNDEARPIYEKLCSGGWKVNKFIIKYILKFCLVKKVAYVLDFDFP